MRKSRFASVCLYVSLITLVINILLIIVMFITSYNARFISRIYQPLVYLHIAIFIASIVSIIRVAASKKQLKGMAKSIVGMVLSIVMIVAVYVQGVFAELVISSEDALIKAMFLTEGQLATTDGNVPKYAEKDFDVVAVAKYYNEDGTGKKVGYIDKTGDLVIKAKFEDAKDFYEGLAPAKLNGKWGYIDKTGEFVILPRFDNADIFSSGAALVEVDGQLGFIDKNGDYIYEPVLEKAVRFREGLAPVHVPGTTDVGFIDTTGKFVIEPIYLGVNYFSEGLAFVLVDLDEQIIGLVDREGNYKQLTDIGISSGYFFSEGLLAASKPSEGMGYIDKTGEFVIDPVYFSADRFSEGLAAVGVELFKKGYIDKNGNMVIEPVFHDCEPFSEGLALVEIKDDSGERFYGYIDKTGNFVIEPKFANARSFSEGLALVREYDKGYGFIDKTGNYVIEPEEDVEYGRFHKVDGVYNDAKADTLERKDIYK